MEHIETTLTLLNSSYSVYHAVDNIERLLLAAGFQEISEAEESKLEKGGRYYLKRNGTSIIAFKIPESEVSSFQIAATHNDSPTFRLKPNPILRYKNLVSLNVEPYGGMIMSSWLDRPLSLAGRVFVEKDGKIEGRLLVIDEDLLIIPNVCIHMNREVNHGFAFNPAKDLIPLMGTREDLTDFNAFLGKCIGLKEGEKVISHDLYLYNREPAKLVGLDQPFLAGGRLDDLSAAYTVLQGFLEAEEGEHVSVFASFDNEEVGSLTRQGANSDFLQLTLKRIAKDLGKDFAEMTARSFLFSVDNGHANHPNHPELSDPTTDVRLNGGIVIKYNAEQRYTSDGFSSAIAKLLAKAAGVAYQEYTNRSDLRGGSTLGNLSNAEVSLACCDIGLPQLAMHSSYELLGKEDIEAMVLFMKAYFEKEVEISGQNAEIR